MDKNKRTKDVTKRREKTPNRGIQGVADKPTDRDINKVKERDNQEGRLLKT